MDKRKLFTQHKDTRTRAQSTSAEVNTSIEIREVGKATRKKNEFSFLLFLSLLSSWKKKSHWKEIFLSSSKLQFGFLPSFFVLFAVLTLEYVEREKKLSFQWKLDWIWISNENSTFFQKFSVVFFCGISSRLVVCVHTLYLRSHHHHFIDPKIPRIISVNVCKLKPCRTMCAGVRCSKREQSTHRVKFEWSVAYNVLRICVASYIL